MHAPIIRCGGRHARLALAVVGLASCGPRGAAPIAITPGATPTPDAPPADRHAAPDHPVAPPRPPPPDEPRHACDPFGSERPVAGPAHPPAVCGNGVIDTVWGACTEICTGGCDAPIQCRVECASSPETCDGAATTTTCQEQGYAGGAIRCTSGCELDLGACRATTPTAGLRQGVAKLPGNLAYAISDGTRAAVFALDGVSTALAGATVDAALRTRRLRGLPTRTMAVGALGDRLGFVTDDRRFGTIDLAGKVTLLGAIGDANTPALILPEVGRTGSAAVLLGDYQRRVLTVFDPVPAATPAPVRFFALDNLRVVVIDGGHPLAGAARTGGAPLVILRWGDSWAFTDAGDHLAPLAAVPAGVAFSETPELIDDALTWPGGGRRVRYARSWSLYLAPPAGLSRAAVAGASLVGAFGGTLVAHADADGSSARTELYWLPMPAPLTATVTSP